MFRTQESTIVTGCRVTVTSARRQGFWSEVRAGVSLLLLWMERSRQRAALAELNDDQLSDIGLSRQDVRRECAKPFWDA